MRISYELGDIGIEVFPIHGKNTQGILMIEGEDGDRNFFKSGVIHPITVDKQKKSKSDWIFPVEIDDTPYIDRSFVHAHIGRGLVLIAEGTPFNETEDYNEAERTEDIRREGPLTIVSGLQSDFMLVSTRA